MLANLVADSGAGKGQLSSIVEGLCPEHISKASRSHISNFNNQNSMKNTKTKETHKCKPQEAMVSSP